MNSRTRLTIGALLGVLSILNALTMLIAIWHKVDWLVVGCMVTQVFIAAIHTALRP